MSFLKIGIISFVIITIIASVTFMFSSTKQSGINEQKILQFQEIIKAKEHNENIAARPSATVNELLSWLREHE